MLEPEEVSAILRLNELGWGAKRIARELGISRNTAKDYIAAGGWTPYRQPRRKKALDGQEAWLRERLRRHRGNADVIRQELATEKGIIVSLRTVERAVQRYRQELAAEARATVRFETPPGKQLQIDFGERLVEIGGSKVRAYLFVATHIRAGITSGHSATNDRRAGSMDWKVRLPSSGEFRRRSCSITPGLWWSSMIPRRVRWYSTRS
jgi:transposase